MTRTIEQLEQEIAERKLSHQNQSRKIKYLEAEVKKLQDELSVLKYGHLKTKGLDRLREKDARKELI